MEMQPVHFQSAQTNAVGWLNFVVNCTSRQRRHRLWPKRARMTLEFLPIDPKFFPPVSIATFYHPRYFAHTILGWEYQPNLTVVFDT